MQHQLGVTFIEGPQMPRDTFPFRACETEPLRMVGCLNEMPQLQMLVLHEASPIALPAPLPSIKRTITLPSLSVLDLSASARDCGPALAHLILPALTRLRIAARSTGQDGSDVREILPNVSKHAHVFQNTQSMSIRNGGICTSMHAWADVSLRKTIAILDEMPPAPLEFSFTSSDWSPVTHSAVFDAAIAALPFENLVSLTSQDRMKDFKKQVWHHHAQM